MERDALALALVQGWTFLTRPVDVEGGLSATLIKNLERMFLLVAPPVEDSDRDEEAIAERIEQGASALAVALDLGVYQRIVYAVDLELPAAIREALERGGVEVWSRLTLQRLREPTPGPASTIAPAQLRVDAIRVRGLRGVKSLDLTQLPGLEPVLLVGPNGAGKSTLLDAVAMALSWVSVQIMGQSALGELPTWTEIHRGDSGATVSASATLQRRTVQWELGCPREGRPVLKLAKLKTAIRRLGWLEASTTNTALPLVAHYGVQRAALEALDVFDRTQRPSLTDRADQDLLNIRRGVGGVSKAFFRWFREFEDLENEKRRTEPDYRNHEIEAARRAIGSVMDGYTDLRFDRQLGTLVLHKVTPGVNATLRFEQLSDGEKMLLGLVGDLAYLLARWNPGLTDPLLGGGVVLIDEIELHLHPGWQRVIVSRLRKTFPNIQWFFTTHSPQVISEVPTESVVLLRVENGVVIAERPAFSAGWDTNRILTHLMGVDERPADVREALDAVGALIREESHAEASRRLDALETRLGRFDPEVMHLRSVLDFLRD